MKKAFYPVLFMVLLLAAASCKKHTTEITDPPILPPNDTTHYVQTTPWPQWIFTPWIWEGEGTTQSAKQIADDYISHGIPVGAIIIDSPWETDYNTFSWDSTLYPGAQEMINYFHSKNIRVFLWITGIIDTSVHPLYDYANSHNYFMKASSTATGPGIVSWWKGKGSLIDWYNPDAVAWWKSMMDGVLAYGIDGWKCDGTDYYTALNAPFSPYLNQNVDRLDYSHHYYQLFFDYTRQKLGNDRVITCRPIDNYGYNIGGDFAAFCPKAISWACWVGDQDATFTGLTKALNNMAYSSDYGYLSYGSDIGGYRTDNNYPANGRSKELFLRWAELGAFSPIMENGGGGEHRPWMFDQETNDIYKKFALLREKMVPYLMSTATTAYNSGTSMATYFNKTDYSYMLGDDVFVAPVISSGGLMNVTFPTGNNWVYLFNKSLTYQGGQTQFLSFPLNEYPVFVRQGSDLLNTLNP